MSPFYPPLKRWAIVGRHSRNEWSIAQPQNALAGLCRADWNIVEQFTHAALGTQNVGIESDGFRYADGIKRRIDCNSVYRLIDHGL